MTSDCSLTPVLETDRLLLRAHRLEDFPACAAMWADPAVVAHISGDPSSEEQSFARAAHGRGYATEAVAAMLAWADATLDHPRTVAMVDPAHAASIRVARKVGYSTQVEGRYDDSEALFLYRERRGP